MAPPLVQTISARPRDRYARSILGSRRTRLAVLATVAAVTCTPASRALAAGGVSRAQGATRSALVHAFTVQDGTSRGISGVYVSRSAGIVCQRTPDAGLVRFLFRHTSGSWHYAFTTRGTAQGTATQRALERSCH